MNSPLPIESLHAPPAEAMPNNIEAEQMLLGAILVNNDVALRVQGFLRPHHFYDPAHERIYAAVIERIEQGKTADPVWLAPYFEQDEALQKAGGGAYLVRIAASAATIINAADYARAIVDLWTLREIIATSQEMAQAAKEARPEDDPASLLQTYSERLFELEGDAGGQQGRLLHPEAMVAGAIEHIEAARAAVAEGGVSGVTSGLVDLDEKTGGFQRGDLIILAGRPGMGKTLLAMNITRAAAEAGHGVLFVSQEMSAGQIMTRNMADMAFDGKHPVSYGKALQGRINSEDFDRLKAVRERASALPLFISDARALTAGQVRGLARRAEQAFRKRGLTLDMVVIDYLQLMRGPEAYERQGDKYNSMGAITHALKALAGDFDLPVIALCQLNRKVEGRDNKRPILSDLRDSGNIEEDADVVIGLYREHYYASQNEPSADSAKYNEWLQARESSKWLLENLLLKGRNFETGFVKSYINLICGSIRDRAWQTEMFSEEF